MKRLHMSLNVTNLEKSIQFYSTLFGTAPTTVRDDYAKWMLEDPRVNFVVEASDAPGVTHAGIQVNEQGELDALFNRMQSTDGPYLPEGSTNCCYARSDKSWTADPDGFRWEAFYTHHETEERGAGSLPATAAACCDGGGCC